MEPIVYRERRRMMEEDTGAKKKDEDAADNNEDMPAMTRRITTRGGQVQFQAGCCGKPE